MHGVDYNQSLCLPKAESNTKSNPNGLHSVAFWVRFGVQLDSVEKSDPAIAENCVGVVTISFDYVVFRQPLRRVR